MFLREYLIIDSQNGTCRVRKTPTAGFGEYVIRLDIEIPKPAIPTFTINIPVPAAFPLNVETTAVKYGVPWALSEGIMETRSVSTTVSSSWIIPMKAYRGSTMRPNPNLMMGDGGP